MANSPKLEEFIDRAVASGASAETIVGILKARGWPEKEIYAALAAQYEQQIGVAIPQREESEAAAKDAFFYLLAFATLATWTIGLCSMAFDLIDRWLSDALFQPGTYSSYNIAGSLAAVLVAYPVYLLVTRAIAGQVQQHPEKLHSPVRKWLTYLALVIAAGVFIGDLITALSYFLRGEITSRFLWKVLIVLVVSGGVFFYYFVGLRRSSGFVKEQKPSMDSWMAGLSAVGVIAIVIWGFSSLGPPSTQRMLRADRKRVQDLYGLSTQVRLYWNSKKKMPNDLGEIPGGHSVDPITYAVYEYHLKEGSQYELCGTFDRDSQRDDQRPPALNQNFWGHPPAHHCFSLDAAIESENPYIYLP